MIVKHNLTRKNSGEKSIVINLGIDGDTSLLDKRKADNNLENNHESSSTYKIFKLNDNGYVSS